MPRCEYYNVSPNAPLSFVTRDKYAISWSTLGEVKWLEKHDFHSVVNIYSEFLRGSAGPLLFSNIGSDVGSTNLTSANVGGFTVDNPGQFRYYINVDLTGGNITIPNSDFGSGAQDGTIFTFRVIAGNGVTSLSYNDGNVNYSFAERIGEILELERVGGTFLVH